jgi:hypothetical protein
LTIRDYVTYIEEKCTKLIFSLAKSAKLTWGLQHKALKTIYTGEILLLILYGAPVRKSVLNRSCYKTKLVRLQRLINIRIAKAYRTVSNDALCVITGLMPINLKLEEATKYREMNKGEGLLFYRETEVKNWIHPAKHIAITDGQEDSSHYIHAYTDGSKNEAGVGSGIAIYSDCSLKTTLKFRLNDRCTNRPNRWQF